MIERKCDHEEQKESHKWRKDGGIFMKVTGAWYLDALPVHIVLELENGELKMAPITPLEPIKPERMTAYKGYHPRKCSGHPLPEYLYKFYGLEKDTESLTD